MYHLSESQVSDYMKKLKAWYPNEFSESINDCNNPAPVECTGENFTNKNDMLCEENVHNPGADITINGKRREY